jgi:hypothetical protein
MTTPSVDLTVKDGALGALPPDVSGLSAKIGVCSLGTVGQIYQFGNKDDLIAALGYGPLTEAAAFLLDTTSQQVICVKATTTNGSNSAVVVTGTGTGTVPVSGNPNDSYEAIVEILKAGLNIAAGTATFRYSLDGGKTYSPEIAVPTGGVFVLPNTGLTLTFTNGVSGTSFIVGDLHKFTSTGPTADNTAIGAAFDALLADPREWGHVHVVGATSATKAATAATKMTTAETKFRYAFALLEVNDPASDEAAWITATLAAYASFASVRVAISGGFQRLVSVVSGRVPRSPNSYSDAARIAAIPISQSPARVATGGLPGVTELYHDANNNSSLHDARFMTHRVHIGKQGFFITKGNMMAANGSDFSRIERRRVMDRACQIVRAAMLEFLEETILVNANGTIDNGIATAWETTIKSQLDAALLGEAPHASATAIKIDRNQNVLTTEKVKAKVTVRPLASVSSISVEIGFQSPALVAA